MGLSRQPRPDGAVLFTAALALAGVGLCLLTVPGLQGDLPLGTVALFLAGFAITEALVLHLEVGENAHSVTLSEVTLVLALFFLPVGAIAPVRVVAGGLVLYAVRHQRRLKLVFNVAVWVLDVPVAALVFRALDGRLDAGYGHVVLPATAAAVTAATVDSLAVNAIISITSRQLSLRQVVGFLKACLSSALASSLVAALCVAAVAWSPWTAVPMLGLLLLAVVSLNRFGSLRQQHTTMQELYAFTSEINQRSSVDHVITTITSRAGDLLRAGRVHVVTESAGRFTNSRMLQEAGSRRLVRAAVDPESELHACLRGLLSLTEPLVVAKSPRSSDQRDLLAYLGVRDAVIAPITTEQGTTGLLIAADRAGEHTSFTSDDGLLTQTLATHAAAALANSTLVEQLNHESLHDSLTGLGNRPYFQNELRAALADRRAEHAVLLIDLDRFKEVNDTLGHAHGDLLLCEVAERLQTCLREPDRLARLGGDEFAVLLHGVDLEQATAIADRMMRVMREPLTLQGVTMEVTGSCGLVLAPEHGDDADTLLQRADVAMYLAKHDMAGVQAYAAQQDDYSPRRLALASGLRTAVEAGQLSLRYQPQARAADAVVTGVEALVRWDHPEYGEVRPDEFVAIAEQTGQIRELTRAVLADAVRDCAAWRASGHDLSVSVNISVRNLLEPDLAGEVARALLESGLPAEKLTLEITETHLMADPARTGETLRSLDRLGVRLSVDDFGTGYSSLAYLKQLPVSEVKVDKSFVRDVAVDIDDAAIVEAIISLSHTLGVHVVAEGVEDEASLQTLTALGCDLVQGYHLARPMTHGALVSWLAAGDRSVAQLPRTGAPLPVSRLPRRGAVPAPRPQPAADNVRRLTLPS